MKYLATLSVIVVFAMLAFTAIPSAEASISVVGSGQDRSVIAQTSGENRTSDINLTLPETISKNHTLDGTLTYNHTASSYDDSWYPAPSVAHWINVTVSNSTWTSDTFSAGSLNLSTNTTIDYTIDTNVPTGDYNCSVSFEDNTSGSAIKNGMNLTVMTNSGYMMTSIIWPIAVAGATIIIAAAVLKMFMRIFDTEGDGLM